MTAPKVSVLMSVYNGERYLREAVDSILNQTFTDFEFIIIDDASTDGTAAILDSCTDPRLVRVRNPENLGLTRSLNRGLDLARGEYIARMDADDVSLPSRLSTQVAYMQQHPEVGVVGANFVEIDAEGKLLNRSAPAFKYPAFPMQLRWQMLWANPMPHPTAMIRRSLLQQTGSRYDPDFRIAQDYDLWTRLNQYAPMYRLGEVLLQRRVLPTRISAAQRERQLAAHHLIMARNIKAFLGGEASQTGIDTLFAVIFWCTDQNSDYQAAADLLLTAYKRFLSLPMMSYERERITYDAVYYVLKLSRKGGFRLALTSLWRIRSLLLARVLTAKVRDYVSRWIPSR